MSLIDVTVPREIVDINEVKTNPKLEALRAMSPKEAAQWIDANVTNLSEAKDALGTMAAAIVYLIHRADDA
jgi:anthranilate phosphoribosyltransferase